VGDAKLQRLPACQASSLQKIHATSGRLALVNNFNKSHKNLLGYLERYRDHNQ
jgi:hypothetical protein